MGNREHRWGETVPADFASLANATLHVATSHSQDMNLCSPLYDLPCTPLSHLRTPFMIYVLEKFQLSCIRFNYITISNVSDIICTYYCVVLQVLWQLIWFAQNPKKSKLGFKIKNAWEMYCSQLLQLWKVCFWKELMWWTTKCTILNVGQSHDSCYRNKMLPISWSVDSSSLSSFFTSFFWRGVWKDWGLDTLNGNVDSHLFLWNRL